MVNSEFLQEATERGFVFQCTDTEALDAALRAGTVTAYIGFDCTADSLHVGSLVQIMILRLLQRHGHRPIVLMGGGTTRIGDPSGKDETRQLLTDEQIAANMAGIRRCFDPFLRFGDGPADAIMANNADWLSALGYIPFLREVGTHFTINRMLTFDSVRLRLEREQPLTFLEFNYMILQSYDFRELNRRHRRDAADRRLGPVGQHRQRHRADAAHRQQDGVRPDHAADHHRVGRQDGQDGAGRGVADARPAVALRLLAVLAQHRGRRRRPLPAPVHRPAAGRDRPAGGAGRRRRSTRPRRCWRPRRPRLAHGAEAAADAAETARLAFEEGEAADTLPGVDVPRAELEAGIPAFRLFALAGLAGSNGEARRLIRGGGARINDMPVKDEGHTVTVADLHDDAIKLSAGRKHHRLVRAA